MSNGNSQSIASQIKSITYKSQQRVELFLALAPEMQARVILRLSKHVQSQLLSELHRETILAVLQYLEPDDITDLLQTVPTKRQTELLQEMSEDLQSSLSMLLKFDPKTAAGLMSLNYVQVKPSEKLSEVVTEIQKHEKRTGKLPTPLVVDNGTLVGQVLLQQLLFAKPGDFVKDYIAPIASITDTARSSEVVEHFLNHPHERVAVLGENKTILGVLYSDDVLRELDQRESSTLYDFAGLNAEESVDDGVEAKVNNRYKWLVTNLATAFLASFVVSLFDETISRFVLLAVYMPIVAGMGGNAATQTLAVLVRGISQGQIDLHNALPALRREVGAGLINGFINGLVVFAIVVIVNHDVKVAFVLAMAMIINLVVAGFFGTLVPLIMKRLGKDPATSATIFITTATDVLGFLAFLGLATLVLN